MYNVIPLLPISPCLPSPYPPTHTVVYVGPPSPIMYKKKKILITNEVRLGQACKDLTLGKSAPIAHRIN